MLKAFGTTTEYTTCDNCGREDLKKTIIMDTVDADGNRDGNESHFGVVCAAKLSGRTEKEIKEEVKEIEKAQSEKEINQAVETMKQNVLDLAHTIPTCDSPFSGAAKTLASEWLEETTRAFFPDTFKKILPKLKKAKVKEQGYTVTILSLVTSKAL